MAGNQVTWILACDSGRARLFVNRSMQDGVHEMQDMIHPVPKTSELVTGKRGRNKPGYGFLRRHAYDPASNPREKEKEEFVKRLANMLNEREAEYHRLIVAAPPPALHGLREGLSPKVKEKIIGEINKDLTKENESTLQQYIKPFMSVHDPLHDYI